MAKRIGETLIERGFITRRQLDRALKYQLIFGGHLGTSLIELGFVDEEALGRTLADVHGVRYASRELMCQIPPAVIRRLPATLVERYRAVPIDVQGRTLDLAVISPRDLASLSRVTGYRIIPWMAPETQILEALERYYQIPRRPRYLSISARRPTPEPERPIEVSAMVTGLPSLSPIEEAALHPNLAFLGELSPSEMQANTGLATAVAEPAPEAVQIGADDDEHPDGLGGDFGYGGSWRDVADSILCHEQEGQSELTPIDGEASEPGWSFEEVTMLMSHADSREELCALVLSYLSRTMDSCILFGVKSERAYVWDWRGLRLTPGRVTEIKIPVARSSIFDLLLGNDYYCGEVPDEPVYQQFFETLEQRPIPERIVLLPVYLNDRLVALMYGAVDTGRFRCEIDTYEQLMGKFSLALHMIILKSQIRSR